MGKKVIKKTPEEVVSELNRKKLEILRSHEEGKSFLDENGFEVPDSKPMEIPIGWKKPPSLQEQVQRMVRHEMSRAAEKTGQETFEEADDFDIPDDPVDLTSPYEVEFDPYDPSVPQAVVEEKPAEDGVKKDTAASPEEKTAEPTPKEAAEVAQ